MKSSRVVFKTGNESEVHALQDAKLLKQEKCSQRQPSAVRSMVQMVQPQFAPIRCPLWICKRHIE